MWLVNISPQECFPCLLILAEVWSHCCCSLQPLRSLGCPTKVLDNEMHGPYTGHHQSRAVSHHMDLWALFQQPLPKGYGHSWEKDNINLATMLSLLLFRCLLNPRRTSNTHSSDIYHQSQPWHRHISHISPVVLCISNSSGTVWLDVHVLWEWFGKS